MDSLLLFRRLPRPLRRHKLLRLFALLGGGGHAQRVRVNGAFDAYIDVRVAALSTGLGLYFSVGGDYDRCRDQAAAGTYCTDDALAGFKKRDQAGVGLMIAGGTLLALDVGLLIASIKLRRPVRP